MLGEIGAAIEEARHQKLIGVGIAEHDAGALGRRNHVDGIAKLLAGERRGFPGFGVGIFWDLDGMRSSRARALRVPCQFIRVPGPRESQSS